MSFVSQETQQSEFLGPEEKSLKQMHIFPASPQPSYSPATALRESVQGTHPQS